MRDAIRDILAPEGYDIECFLTGPAGLEALRRDPPDLLLLDIMLATPSQGFHLAYEMKDDARLKDIPIIMISAIGQRMGMDYMRELGTEYMPAEAFLEKPLSAKTLREAVHRVVQGARARQ
jgi:CheY-like chemotaxis protein